MVAHHELEEAWAKWKVDPAPWRISNTQSSVDLDYITLWSKYVAHS